MKMDRAFGNCFFIKSCKTFGQILRRLTEISFPERCEHTLLMLENKILFCVSLTLPTGRKSYTLFSHFSILEE